MTNDLAEDISTMVTDTFQNEIKDIYYIIFHLLRRKILSQINLFPHMEN